LPEATRRELGLSHLSRRAARDGFLLRALMEVRREGGRVDLILGKGNRGGEVFQPSRLLLQAKGVELAQRVKQLFREIPPQEVGDRGAVEESLKWRTGMELEKETGGQESSRLKKLSATKFTDYLACPFRFYLKHVRRLQSPEPSRVELNARDYGTLAHEVLENFGLDEEARCLGSAEKIFEWVSGELDSIVARRFAGRPPVAVCIQVASLRQRLEWFSVCQAEEVVNGWVITEVEKNFAVDIGGFQVTGQVDRIEVNEESGHLRILDYKTKAKAQKVKEAHLTGVRANTSWASHLQSEEAQEAVRYFDGKKDCRWTNLQVPLYLLAMHEMMGAEVKMEAGYFSLGNTRENVKVNLWEGFGEGEVESARRCAEWVTEQIRGQVFWPPAEEVKYDDYSRLSPSQVLEEGVVVR